MKKYEVKEDGKTINFIEFESINELVKYNLVNLPSKIFASKQVSTSVTRDHQTFTGTKSYEEASNLLLNGWSDGAVKLTKQLKIANQKPTAVEVKRAVNDIVGFQVNVPRYLQGIPNNMINKRSVKQKQKIMTLTKSIDYNSMISPERIMEDSVKFLQIAQAIEKKNIRVNINIFWHAVEGNEEFIIKLKLKSAKERLNISKLSFPLIHPSFLRRISFRAMERETRLTRRSWASGYGAPAGAMNSKKALELTGKDEVYIPVLIPESEALDIVNSIN